LNARKCFQYYLAKRRGFRVKKLMVLLVMLVMALSLAACGGEDVADPGRNVENMPDSSGLVDITGNGLCLALPSDFKYAQTDESNGGMNFADEERNAVVTLGVKAEDAVTSGDITDDVLLAALSGNGLLSDATLERSSTVEHDGGTSVVGFGKATLADGQVMNSVVQYFFPRMAAGTISLVTSMPSMQLAAWMIRSSRLFLR